jgi:flagellin
MAFAIGGNGRIRTNIPAENAYNALEKANKDISLRQLRLSTGKRINNAADDVASYITSRALIARNGSLKSASKTVGDGLNLANIIMDGLDNINGLISTIKESTASASSGSMGTDEKVALAKAAYRMAQQIQTVVNSTVFGGKQLLAGDFYAEMLVGFDENHRQLTISIDMNTNNTDFNLSANNFNMNSLNTNYFGGITNLNLEDLNKVSSSDLGVFSYDKIGSTLYSLANALNNVNKVASYVGGISNRLTSQDDLLKSQITNYNAAISRLEDSDVAQEQLELVKSQFLQQASLTSLAQSNQNPSKFLQLVSG